MANHVQANSGETAKSPAQPETVEGIIEDVSTGVTPVFDFLVQTFDRVAAQILSAQGLYQLGLIIGALVLARIAAAPLRVFVRKIWPQDEETGIFMKSAYGAVDRLVLPLIWAVILWFGLAAFRRLGIGADLVRLVASLLQAWVLINLFSALVRDPFWSRSFATIAWIVAALNILKLLNPLIAILDGLALTFGESRLSVYMMLKAIAMLVVLIWLASVITRFVQTRLGRAENLTPSVRSLIAQSVRIAMLFAAVVIAMNVVGVDLTALAVFSGAVGVGIGFGLQAIFSNLVSGVIMLMEGSIKVGDFVELESGLTGEVREINTRSTLVTTNDNVDILIPNSEFINARVTNWTLREAYRRLRVPFGVAYGSDKDLVKKAALEAAQTVPHMLTGKGARPPQVWLVGFGDSSLDFELVVWLKPEAVKRPSAVSADYNWAIESALGKYGIEIPFPQRDLHIRSGSLPINLTAVTPPSEKVEA